MQVAKLRTSTRGKVNTFTVRPDQPATLGRGEGCTIRVDDPKVSRSHCQLAYEGGRLVVTDLGSSHGLVHRGQKCASFSIEVGDGFHVGETFIRFDAIEAAEALADAPPPPIEKPKETPRPAKSAPTVVQEPDEEPDDPEEEDEPVDEADRYADIGKPRPRRRKKKRPNLFVLLFGWLLLLAMTVAATIAVILFLEDKYGLNVYDLKDWLRDLLKR